MRGFTKRKQWWEELSSITIIGVRWKIMHLFQTSKVWLIWRFGCFGLGSGWWGLGGSIQMSLYFSKFFFFFQTKRLCSFYIYENSDLVITKKKKKNSKFLDKLAPMVGYVITSLHITTWSDVRPKKCCNVICDGNDIMWCEMWCHMTWSTMWHMMSPNVVKKLGFFLEIFYDHLWCCFGMIFAPSNFLKKQLCMCKCVEVLETKYFGD